MSVIKEKVVTTRKSCQCFGCERRFPKGTTIKKVTWRGDNKLETYAWCKVCENYWAIHMRYDDEICFGELRNEDPEGWTDIYLEVEHERQVYGNDSTRMA